ncbi:MAG: Rrf2 family transcriptional regulator [Deltaproteobacteria bacterium]|jgi:Rrf2 family protein|nr:Rrf2 family transcriptional regulator [Deltaproteobacteria bacterium]MBT4527644.1 Rrf2 family transcriptional regulator [Deltaproteobacteria bacterium]
MKITKETDYAIICVLYLAVRRFDYVTVAEIADSYNIPKAFLSKIFQKLSKANLIFSRQGKKGGFKLTGQPIDITLMDIYNAIHGCLAINICVNQKGACERMTFCGIKPIWNEINQIIIDRLKATNFADLAQKEIERLYHQAKKNNINSN